jgi:pro-apoptotic serine protease NMA111
MRYITILLFLVIASLSTSTHGATPDQTWEEVLERVVPTVVSIKVTATRDFDTEDAANSQGTGFVVDAEQGFILTNRHMVHAGPVVAEALFLNQEEVELKAVYRDPVHDFGFYQFNPDDLDDMELVELPLDPAGAKVGIDIRVVGNDSGEKLSILDGTLSRLDRNAPNYGQDSYNDFNTFYIQAASNTSGGSSGSPVVDIRGHAVALNAGGKTRAASSFYLPLDRAVRALKYLQRGESPARGTLQTVFVFEPFDELQRLGLADKTKDEFRQAFPDSIGMLKVAEVILDGPAHGELHTADILVRLNGQLVGDFVSMEEVLDDSVGETVKLEVDRNGEAVTFELPVGDLHAISPDEYLEVGRAVLNRLSYMQARNYKVPAKGVYVSVPGYMLSTAEIPEGSVITHIDGVATPDLDTFTAELESKSDGQLVRFRFWVIRDQRHAYETVARMERHWFSMQRCKRNDHTGLWPCIESPPPPAPEPSPPVSSLLFAEGSKVARTIAPSLVVVDFDIPFPTSGVKDRNFVGIGTVVDAERGLVMVDRDTVPVALGDMMITFAGSVRVPGELVYLHPMHNLAIVHYDPDLLGDTPVSAVRFSTKKLKKGDDVWQVGINRQYQLVSQQTKVKEYDTLTIGLSATPRFRDGNIEGISTEDSVPSLGGVLTDKKGRVHALWASFLDQRDGDRTFHGLTAEFILPIIDPLMEGRKPAYRVLGAEFREINLVDARDRGVPPERVKELLAHDPKKRKVLEVARLTGGTSAHLLLRDADLLVAVNGKPVTRMGELEALAQEETLEVMVVRDAEELVFTVETTPLDGKGVDRVLSWAGLLAHSPHHEVAAQRGLEPKGVYIAWMWYGTPSSRYGLRPTRRIFAIDDQEVEDLDSMIEIVRSMSDRQPIRVKMLGLDGSVHVKTLKLDLQYWPTELLELSDGEWTRSRVAE